MTGLEFGVVQVSAGRSSSCAVLEGGTIRCWGAQLGGGIGGSGVNEPEPVEVDMGP